MTNEGLEPTQAWMEKHKGQYAYAIEDGRIARHFNVSGIPNSVLVGSDGRVLWQGHPSKIDTDMLERAVQGALTVPLWSWPEGMRSAFDERQYGRVLAGLANFKERAADVKTFVEKRIATDVTSMEADHQVGNYLDAHTLAVALEGGLADGEDKQRAARVREAIEGDATAMQVVEGQKALREIRKSKVKRSDIPELVKRVKAMRDKHPGTAVAREAEELLAILERASDK